MRRFSGDGTLGYLLSTSAKAARNLAARRFDPLPEKAAKPLQKKAELSPEEKLREMEREIHRLVRGACGNPAWRGSLPPTKALHREFTLLVAD